MFYETMYLVSVYTRINMCEHLTIYNTFPNFYAIIIHTSDIKGISLKLLQIRTSNKF